MKRRRILAGALLLLLLAAGAGALALRRELSPVAGEAPELLFTVSPGETLEEIALRVSDALRGSEVARPIPRLTWHEAMERFGTDKPDLRFGMEIHDLGGVFSGTEFNAFGATLEAGGTVRGINAGPLGLARSGLDGLVTRAQELGAKGLVWMVLEEDGSMRSTATVRESPSRNDRRPARSSGPSSRYGPPGSDSDGTKPQVP